MEQVVGSASKKEDKDEDKICHKYFGDEIDSRKS